MSPTTADVRPCDQIDLRSPDDLHNSDITAAHVLPDGRLILVDMNNSCVKLFDSARKLTARVDFFPLRAFPSINDDTFVVTDMTYDLKCVSVSGTDLVLRNTIQTPGKCYGLAYFENQIIVTDMQYGETVRLLVLDMSGNVISRLTTDMRNGWHVVVNQATRVVYVSERQKQTVTCMTLQGTVLSAYKHDKLKNPHGMVLHPDGSVYVCGWLSNNIHHITSQCTHIETLLDNGELRQPLALHICHNTSGARLYVAESYSNTMKVFEM